MINSLQNSPILRKSIRRQHFISSHSQSNKSCLNDARHIQSVIKTSCPEQKKHCFSLPSNPFVRSGLEYSNLDMFISSFLNFLMLIYSSGIFLCKILEKYKCALRFGFDGIRNNIMTVPRHQYDTATFFTEHNSSMNTFGYFY